MYKYIFEYLMYKFDIVINSNISFKINSWT